jgi:phosphoesterase RecJ-like protein
MVLQDEFTTVIRKQLENAHKVLVLTHQRPDGDAIGSLLGIGMALIDAGKEVQMVLSDGTPGDFSFLAGSELITTKPTLNVDYIIVVDSGDLERTDVAIKDFNGPDLVIDHHKTNTKFAKVNLVQVDAVATAEILAHNLPEFGLRITKPIADALLVGIITDTIGFRTTNMRPQALRSTADLMELGGNLVGIYYRTVVEQTYSAARYWGAGLSKLQMEDGLVWTTLSLIDRQSADYPYRDDADLIKILSAIAGAKIAVILTEQSEGYVKISWRLCGSSPTNLDVSEIAQKYNGGGHKAAAGADVSGKLDEVLEAVLTDTRLYMEKN